MASHTRRAFLKAFSLSLTAVAAPLPLLFCERKNNDRRPNIVFLFSDDHSVPDLGCYGNPGIQTPNLDRMAEEGMRFDRAYVTSPQCSPSRAAILTGRVPHDVHASRLHAPVPPYDTNLIDLLKAQGYHTGAYRKVHQPHIQKDFDFYRGNDESLATFFRDRPEHKPFFLWFGSRDPHRGYKAGAFQPPHDPEEVTVPDFLPDTPEVRQDLAYYYDEIARFDKECGQILSLLEQHGLTGNTMVVMAGDNGMPFPRAKGTLYEPGIKVPLLIKWPGQIDAGRVSQELVSLTDLTATWLEAAGTQVPKNMHARSLMPVFRKSSKPHREYVYAERNWHDNWDPMRCVVSERYKLIQNYRPEAAYMPSLDLYNSPSYKVIQRQRTEGALSDPLTWYALESRPQVEFYDLREDPGEWENLAYHEEYREMVRKYQRILSEWMQETHDFLPPPRGSFPGGLNSVYNSIDPLTGRERNQQR